MTTLQIIAGPVRGKSFNLEGKTVFIGRSSKNDIQLSDPTVSRKQIKLYRIGTKLFIEDLKSTNGSWLNDSLVLPGEGFEVGEGDIITLGNTAMLITDSPSPTTPHAGERPFPKPKDVRGRSRKPDQERRKKQPGNLELFHAVSKLIRSSLSLQEMFDSVLKSLLETLPRIDRATLIMSDTEKEEIEDVISRSRENVQDAAKRYSHTVVDRVIRERKAVRMSNTALETPSNLSESVDTLKICSLLCVPLVSNEKTYGVLYVDSLSQPYGFRKNDLFLLNALSGALALKIENARLKNHRKER